MSATLAKLIVCEKTGRWAVALRQVLAAESLPVFETRSLPDCWEELAASPASFIALEATTANVQRVAEWIVGLRQDFPAARTVVLADRKLQSCETLLREAGAIQVLYSPRELASVSKLIGRHIALVPQKSQTPREQIWDRLPWIKSKT